MLVNGASICLVPSSERLKYTHLSDSKRCLRPSWFVVLVHCILCVESVNAIARICGRYRSDLLSRYLTNWAPECEWDSTNIFLCFNVVDCSVVVVVVVITSSFFSSSTNIFLCFNVVDCSVVVVVVVITSSFFSSQRRNKCDIDLSKVIIPTRSPCTLGSNIIIFMFLFRPSRTNCIAEPHSKPVVSRCCREKIPARTRPFPVAINNVGSLSSLDSSSTNLVLISARIGSDWFSFTSAAAAAAGIVIHCSPPSLIISSIEYSIARRQMISYIAPSAIYSFLFVIVIIVLDSLWNNLIIVLFIFDLSFLVWDFILLLVSITQLLFFSFSFSFWHSQWLPLLLPLPFSGTKLGWSIIEAVVVVPEQFLSFDSFVTDVVEASTTRTSPSSCTCILTKRYSSPLAIKPTSPFNGCSISIHIFFLDLWSSSLTHPSSRTLTRISGGIADVICCLSWFCWRSRLFLVSVSSSAATRPSKQEDPTNREWAAPMVAAVVACLYINFLHSLLLTNGMNYRLPS